MEMEGFHYNQFYDYSNHKFIIIGEMDHICKFCGAQKFKTEAPGLCCSNGKVILPPLKEPPNPLRHYVSGDSPAAKHYQRNNRKYNSIFQLTSFGATKICNNDEYLPTFKVQGN